MCYLTILFVQRDIAYRKNVWHLIICSALSGKRNIAKGILDNAVQLLPVCKAGLETKFLVQNTPMMQKNPLNSIIRKEKAVFDLSLIFSCSFNSSSHGDACAALTHVSLIVLYHKLQVFFLCCIGPW